MRSATRRRDRLLLQALTTAAAVVAYELLSRADTSLLPRNLFPPPTVVAGAAYEELQRRLFWESVFGTMKGWAGGLLLAAAVAVPLGIALGSNRWAWRSVRLTTDVLRPLPSLALLPLFVLLIGLNVKLKIWVIAVAAFWPLLVQTVYGVQDVERVAADLARVYRVRRRDRFTRIMVPTALPYVSTGMRISAVIALNVGIAEEMIVGGLNPGLGKSIYLAQNASRFDQMYVFIVAAGLLGLLINVGFRRLERHVLFWHPSQRGELTA
jgi:ABC-type nitrate/sulfonate/bicarbonate transport system permease component